MEEWNHIFTSHTNYTSGHTDIQDDTSIGFSQKPDQSSQDQNPGKGNIIFLSLSFCALYTWIIVLSTDCQYNTKVSLVALSCECLYVRYILQHTSLLWFRIVFFRLASLGLNRLHYPSTHGTVTLLCQTEDFSSFFFLVWHHFRKRPESLWEFTPNRDLNVSVCSSGPWKLWNNLPVGLTNYFAATGDKQINSHHSTEREPNAPLNGIFFWMQIMTKVCSVMNWSFHQYFMENNLSLNAQCLYPWTFMKGPIYDFTWNPPHTPTSP